MKRREALRLLTGLLSSTLYDMARFNEILVGRFNRGLQKLVGVKGEPPSPQIASEIQPTFPIRLGADFRYLESWNRYSLGDNFSALAANVGRARIRNPLGSNIIVVLEQIWMASSAADTIFLQHGIQNADLTTVENLASARWDPRGGPSPNAVVSKQQSANAFFGGNAIVLPTSGNIPISLISTENQEIPLLPGDSLELQQNTVNLSFWFAFWWRERFLEDSERT